MHQMLRYDNRSSNKWIPMVYIYFYQFKAKSVSVHICEFINGTLLFMSSNLFFLCVCSRYRDSISRQIKKCVSRAINKEDNSSPLILQAKNHKTNLGAYDNQWPFLIQQNVLFHISCLQIQWFILQCNYGSIKGSFCQPAAPGSPVS